MRAQVAVALAAVALLSLAAAEVCDPSRSQCASASHAVSVAPVGVASARPQLGLDSEGPRDGGEPRHYRGSTKFQVSGGLYGAKVLGALYWGGKTPNYFDQGYGYGNRCPEAQECKRPDYNAGYDKPYQVPDDGGYDQEYYSSQREKHYEGEEAYERYIEEEEEKKEQEEKKKEEEFEEEERLRQSIRDRYYEGEEAYYRYLKKAAKEEQERKEQEEREKEEKYEEEEYLRRKTREEYSWYGEDDHRPYKQYDEADDEYRFYGGTNSSGPYKKYDSYDSYDSYDGYKGGKKDSLHVPSFIWGGSNERGARLARANDAYKKDDYYKDDSYKDDYYKDDYYKDDYYKDDYYKKDDYKKDDYKKDDDYKKYEKYDKYESYEYGGYKVDYGRGYGPFPDEPVVAYVDWEDSATDREFVYEGQYNRLTVDITPNGRITLLNEVKVVGVNKAFDVILHSHAFDGYQLADPVSNFSVQVTGIIDEETIRISVPSVNISTTAQLGFYEAVFQLFVCNASAPQASCCSTSGQYLHKGVICNPSLGVCDVPERCTGHSPLCPLDVVKPKGTWCNAVTGPCDLPDVCDGTATGCESHSRAVGDKCPWFPDCPNCQTQDHSRRQGTVFKAPPARAAVAAGGKKGYGYEHHPEHDDMNWPLCFGVCNASLICVKQQVGHGCCYYHPEDPHQAEAMRASATLLGGAYYEEEATKSYDSYYKHGGAGGGKKLVCW